MLHRGGIKHIEKGVRALLHEGNAVFLAEDAPPLLLALANGIDIAKRALLRQIRNGLGHIACLQKELHAERFGRFDDLLQRFFEARPGVIRAQAEIGACNEGINALVMHFLHLEFDLFVCQIAVEHPEIRSVKERIGGFETIVFHFSPYFTSMRGIKKI